MKLEDLQKSLAEMNHDEKLDLIRSIREDRKISKHAITHKAKKQKDAGDRLEDRFKKLSPEEQAELIRLLGSGEDEDQATKS